MSRFARAGIARVLLISRRARDAFQYYLVYERRMFFYRLAFDPDFSALVPRPPDDPRGYRGRRRRGAERAEFLGGDERYKVDLADSNEPLYESASGSASSWRGRAEAMVAGRMLDARLRFKRSRACPADRQLDGRRPPRTTAHTRLDPEYGETMIGRFVKTAQTRRARSSATPSPARATDEAEDGLRILFYHRVADDLGDLPR